MPTPITVTRTAAVDGLAFDINADAVLLRLDVGGAAVALSKDPTDTYAKITSTPGVNGLNGNRFGFAQQGYPLQLNIPVSKGERIFLSFAGSSNAYLWLEYPNELLS
jgi:hypothetical protein